MPLPSPDKALAYYRSLEDKHLQLLVASLPDFAPSSKFLAVAEEERLRFIPAGTEAQVVEEDLVEYTQAVVSVWGATSAEANHHERVRTTAADVRERLPQADMWAHQYLQRAVMLLWGTVFEKELLLKELPSNAEPTPIDVDNFAQLLTWERYTESQILQQVPTLVSEYIVSTAGQALDSDDTIVMTMFPIAALGQVRAAGVWFGTRKCESSRNDRGVYPSRYIEQFEAVRYLLDATLSWNVTDVFIARLLAAIVELKGQPSPSIPPQSALVEAFAHLYHASSISFIGADTDATFAWREGDDGRKEWTLADKRAPFGLTGSGADITMDLQPDIAKLLGFSRVAFRPRYQSHPGPGRRLEEFRQLINTKLSTIVSTAEDLRQALANEGYKRQLHIFGHWVGNYMKAAGLPELRRLAARDPDGTVPAEHVRTALDLIWPLWGIGDLCRVASNLGPFRLEWLHTDLRKQLRDRVLAARPSQDELLEPLNQLLTCLVAAIVRNEIHMRPSAIVLNGKLSTNSGQPCALFPFGDDECLGGTAYVTMGLFELIRNACRYLDRRPEAIGPIELWTSCAGPTVQVDIRHPMTAVDVQARKRRPRGQRSKTIEEIQWLESSELMMRHGRIVETVDFAPDGPSAVSARWTFNWSRIEWEEPRP